MKQTPELWTSTYEAETPDELNEAYRHWACNYDRDTSQCIFHEQAKKGEKWVTDNETLEKVYTAENHEELMDAYRDWAGDYDADTVGAFGYVAHEESAKALVRVVEDRSAVILDAGAGTGLVGEELKRRGYKTIDALDYSKEMLDEAEKKGIYKKLIHADMSKPLDVEDNGYDAVVCTGTFTFGHVDADAFDELVRITKPGGAICFTIREGAYEKYGYRKRMIELERTNAWELLSMVEADYLKNEGVTCKLCTCQVAKAAVSNDTAFHKNVPEKEPRHKGL